MSELRKNMERDLQIKGYSTSTQDAYLKYVQAYAKYFNKSPDQLGVEEIKEYLHYLITVKKVSHSYVKTVYSALKFFYEVTLQREWSMKEIPRSKKPKKLPVVLSKPELNDLFNAVTNLKHRAILVTIYAAGLRISEAVNLKVSDIDSKNMQIRVVQGKGQKDRYTLLSSKNVEILRDYWKYHHPTDWLFPGNSMDKPISTRTIQKVFKTAKNKAGIKKEATVHTLRHSFATHLVEAGTSIYHIQQLMGHTSPKTTSVYIHISRKDILQVRSPFDSMVDF
ncbi:MAG: site-specific integrase [Clostridiaceae bacterium]|nr:site-specific integrase [Clostridiaceae bacterium]